MSSFAKVDNNDFKIELTCTVCGLSSSNDDGNRYAVYEDLKRKGASIFPFVGTRCKCGAIDSFKESSNK